MTRRYDQPVEVRRRDEDPAEFLWRGRLYVVRAVLAHWVETGAWWRASSGSAALVLDPSQAGEREVWRVEASAGRQAGTGVYDLCFDWSADSADSAAASRWVLLRAMD
jgi:hypothetical protein